MSKELSVGASKTRSFLVDRDRTIDFMGEEARVYATPSLVRDIEHACRDLIFEHLPDGEDSVGMTVTVAHLAPTLLDMEVTVVVAIAEIDGRKITFDVEARDPLRGAERFSRALLAPCGCWEACCARVRLRAPLGALVRLAQ